MIIDSLVDRRAKKQEERVSVHSHLVREGKNGVVDVGKNRSLFHLRVRCIHVAIFDVVPEQRIVVKTQLTHLIVSLKSTVSCGTTPIACLRLAWL